MKKIPFNTSEFFINPEWITMDVCDKLWKMHIIPMADVRHELGVWVTASQKSGYRPKDHELKKGRSGNSQHTFEGLGAIDWTCQDFESKRNNFLHFILKHTEYTRLAIYDGFIHCDYKATDGNRYIFRSDTSSNWELINTIKIDS